MNKLLVWCFLLSIIILNFLVVKAFAASLPGNYFLPVGNCPNNNSGSLVSTTNECVRKGFGIDGNCPGVEKTPDGRPESGYTGWESNYGTYTNGFKINSLTFTGCGGVGIKQGWDCGVRTDMSCVSSTQCIKSAKAQSGALCEPAGWCDGDVSCSNGQVCDTSTNKCVNAPTATNTPTPKDTPTNTPTPGPSATPTPILTTGDITVHLEAIDTDNTPPPGGQLHNQRNLVLFLYKDVPSGVDFSKAVPNYIKTGTVNQVVDNSLSYNGYFRQKTFPLIGVTSGKYFFLVKDLEGSLVEEIGTGSIDITAGQSNILVDIDNTGAQNGAPTTAPMLRMGDIITDCSGPSDPNCSYNLIGVLDYNALVDCFGPKITSANCVNHHLSVGHPYNIADLNDDGQVDGTDYTMVLKYYNFSGVGGTSQNGGKDN